MTCYTAIYGNYEELKEPTVVTPGWRYICFTDQDVSSKVWEIVRVPAAEDPIRAARRRKILTYEYFEISIWVDGSFQVNCDLNQWWNKHFVFPMTVIAHPDRSCAYAEAEVCIKNQRGNEDDIKTQIEIYRSEGMPENSGLIQSGILMRENAIGVKAFCDLWYEQIDLSARDQIGFAYAEWKGDIKWPRIKYDYRVGKEFLFKKHYQYRK